MKNKILIYSVITLFFGIIPMYGQTTIQIFIPQERAAVNPMIYGQMLEDCNDKIIYGGLVNSDGSENAKVKELLEPLQIPVMRWPAGTYITEYDWEKGVGPKESRPVVPCYTWGGVETNQFGTDEFLQWCERMGVEPYINFNMGNTPQYGGSLGDALNWIDYANGTAETLYGRKRIANGRIKPYNVKYWGIGNENYAPWGRHTAETAHEYATKLNRWGTAIRTLYPELKLMGVGHKYQWNDTILSWNAHVIDYLTLHFYLVAWVKDDQIQGPDRTLFAPAVIEANIEKNIKLLAKINRQAGRTSNPIRISIDEWNNRHNVFDTAKGNYYLQRQDYRRQFDVATAAGMLNVFIRQSPDVAMANYIFPVNGHGLIRTVDEQDAYAAPSYHVFRLYGRLMQGSLLDTQVQGPGRLISDIPFVIDGDINEDVDLRGKTLPFVDAAAVLTNTGDINIALLNRSTEECQQVKLKLPLGYKVTKKWEISSKDINATNTAESRENITPTEKAYTKDHVKLSPCGVIILQLTKTK